MPERVSREENMSADESLKCVECGAVLWANTATGQQSGEPELKATGAKAALTCPECGRINPVSEIVASE